MKKFRAWAERVGEPKATIIVVAAYLLVMIGLAVPMGLFMPDSWDDPFGEISSVVMILAVAFLMVQSRLTRHRNVPVELPTAIGQEVDRLLTGEQRPEAIKYVNTQTGIGLKASLRAVNHRADHTTGDDSQPRTR